MLVLVLRGGDHGDEDVEDGVDFGAAAVGDGFVEEELQHVRGAEDLEGFDQLPVRVVGWGHVGRGRAAPEDEGLDRVAQGCGEASAGGCGPCFQFGIERGLVALLVCVRFEGVEKGVDVGSQRVLALSVT